MQDVHALLLLAVRLALLIGVPAVFALLLRLLGAGRGGAARSIGLGVIAGVIIGPGIAGRLVPDLSARFLKPGEPVTHAVVALLSVALFIGSWGGRRERRSMLLGEDVPDLLTAVGAAALSLAVVALPVAIVLVWLLGFDRAEALALGAAFGSGSAFARVTLRRVRRIGRTHEARMFVGCGLLLSFVVVAALAPPDRVGLLPAPSGAFAAGTIARRLAPLSARWRARLRGAMLLLTAGCSAHLVSLVEPSALGAGWQPVAFVLAVLLVSDDLAAIGAGLGWLTFGRAGVGVGYARRFMESRGLGSSLTMVGFGVALWSLGMLDPASPSGAAVVVALLLRGLAGEAVLGVYRAVLDAATEE